MKTQEIRDKFIKFFSQNGHKKVESSPLIPKNDPTLLFANAGMNQFKDYFTGQIKSEEKRYVTIQKCVRAGGKHNDLDNVGQTARHHTFFEMLGNFSIGDYFKKEAIQFAWDFLTLELKIPQEKLYVTVHNTDNEAFYIWQKDIGLSKDKIFKRGDKDNFWEMGETGPCGPCSEIFYDHGEQFNDPNFKLSEAQDLVDDESRYVEIWNLVFMQYEKSADGLKDLPKKSIDTGAGLERIAAVMQSKYWNYDTDAFRPIIKKIEEISGKSYVDEKSTSNMRVVADHARSCSMLITDGVIPSNEGRGYVLRRIIRRAVRHLKELGVPAGSFYKLIPAVFDVLGEEYPQNASNQTLAEKLIKIEEKKFLETLEQGIKFLEDAIKSEVKDNLLPGEMAFKLYDTFGFPIDLTEVILKEKSIRVDMDGFKQCMQKRKEDSKKSWKGGTAVDNKVFSDALEKYGKTKFVGPSVLNVKSKLLAILDIDDKSALIFKETPFYGESGGQAGDTGTICLQDSEICEVIDTLHPVDDLTVHYVKDSRSLSVGSVYELQVDVKKRLLISYNHSATHLLHSALRSVLGDHVKQSGSSVTPDRLRFDFTHTQGVTKKELKRVEAIVNEEISKGLSVEWKHMTRDDAIKEGAVALFGEKYGDEVRVVRMGDFSCELCGGIHVSNTSEIGYFKIISESSLSNGIRRVEALTSTTSINYLGKRSEVLEEVEVVLSDKEERIISKVKSLQLALKEKQKEINTLQDQLRSKASDDIFSEPEQLQDNFVYKAVEVSSDDDLRKLSDIFVSKNSNGILLIYSIAGDKVSVLLRMAGKNKKVNCSNILKTNLAILDGRGGGRPDMAQGSGKKENLQEFISKTKEMILKNLEQ